MSRRRCLGVMIAISLGIYVEMGAQTLMDTVVEILS